MLGFALLWFGPDLWDLFTREVFAGSILAALLGGALIVGGVASLAGLLVRPRDVFAVPPAEEGAASPLRKLDEAMVRTHRARPHVQPARHPGVPTQALPRVDADATQVLPHTALNSPTQVLYIVLPVDERERAR